jgi:hypothetical protein
VCFPRKCEAQEEREIKADTSDPPEMAVKTARDRYQIIDLPTSPSDLRIGKSYRVLSVGENTDCIVYRAVTAD